MQKAVRRSECLRPHDGVFTRLGPSKTHGIGVFAIRAIKKSANVFEHDDSKMVWLEDDELKGLPGAIKKLYEDFGVFKNGRYGCPRSFNQLTPAWYVNSSKDPNLRCDENYDFIAVRDIKQGEELTLDYSTYSEK